MALLKESRRAYESQKELQRQLVQREKLASLGNLVAGAAHDINHPLNAVMTHSDELWAKAKLTDEQDALLRKIVNQARRTQDLITNLLSFAQQAPGVKTAVDLSVLLGRAIQMLESRRPRGNLNFRVCLPMPISFFKRSSRSLRTPWKPWRNLAAAYWKSPRTVGTPKLCSSFPITDLVSVIPNASSILSIRPSQWVRVQVWA